VPKKGKCTGNVTVLTGTLGRVSLEAGEEHQGEEVFADGAKRPVWKPVQKEAFLLPFKYRTSCLPSRRAHPSGGNKRRGSPSPF